MVLYHRNESIASLGKFIGSYNSSTLEAKVAIHFLLAQNTVTIAAWNAERKWMCRRKYSAEMFINECNGMF
jgi:hypothetical protein